MSNKKQIRLRTIHIDLAFASHSQVESTSKVNRYIVDSPELTNKPLHSLYHLLPRRPEKHKKRTASLPSSIANCSINKKSIENYLPVKGEGVFADSNSKTPAESKSVPLKMFMQSLVKNRIATEASNFVYPTNITHTIMSTPIKSSPFQQIQMKLQQSSKKSRPHTSKLTPKQQHYKKRVNSSWNNHAKEEIRPWQTSNEERLMTEWWGEG